jgi:hypothetical protein
MDPLELLQGDSTSSLEFESVSEDTDGNVVETVGNDGPRFRAHAVTA